MIQQLDNGAAGGPNFNVQFYPSQKDINLLPHCLSNLIDNSSSYFGSVFIANHNLSIQAQLLSKILINLGMATTIYKSINPALPLSSQIISNVYAELIIIFFNPEF